MIVVDLSKRQFGIEAPTGSGISDSSVVVDSDFATATLTQLAVDSVVPTGTQLSAPPLIATGSSTPIITSTISISSSAPSAEGTPVVEQAAASSKSISLGTVVGSCVGAFLGAALLILVAFFYYRRYFRTLKQKARGRGLPRSPYKDHSRGPEEDHRSQPWNRLDDNDVEDKWEGMNKPSPVVVPMQQNGNLAPLEKMDLFTKTPSTASHHSDEPAFEMNNHPYSQANHQKMPEARDLLGREPQNILGQIDSGPPISWASESSKSSFLSATRLEGGAMSPTLAMAIPTPPAIKSQPHHWESAEVINPIEHSAEVVNDSERSSRTSLHNPFFSGGNDHILPKRTRSQSQSSTRSRSNSNATITQHRYEMPKPSDTLPAPGKGKDRVVSIDPFKDPLPLPSFIRHQPTSSASSAADNERAIKQLVAAAGIDLNEEEIQRRLKAVSLQPSIVSYSGDSMYTDADPDFIAEDALRSFPQPPSSSGDGTAR